MKANYIVNNEFVLPSENILQNEIFDNQIAKYVEKDDVVAVLSSIPLFLLEYLGVESLVKQISES